MPKVKKMISRVPAITSVNSLLTEIKKIELLSEYALFRGQDQDWPLIPKIGRLTTKNDNFLVNEQNMLNDFKRFSRPYTTNVPTNDWDWLGLAQHHGMATRLLDWTTNPLAALWFAVSKPIIEHTGIMWLFNVEEEDVIKANDTSKPEYMNPFSQPRTRVFQPNISSNRILAQNAWFTVHKYSKQNLKLFSLEKNVRYKDCLVKYNIPKEFFPTIREELSQLGINKMSLFPDIDGVAYHCEWLNSYLIDEKKKK